MAVQYIIRKAGPFVGDGITTTFSFSFKVMKETDIKVYRTQSTEGESSEDLLVLGVDYTSKLNSDQDTSPGGSITLTAPLATDVRLAIISGEIPDQQVVLTNHDGFLPVTLNDVHDKAIILIQDLWERIERAIVLKPTDIMTPSELRKKIFEAAEKAAASAETAEQFAQICEEIKEYISMYSWDIPHLVDSIRDVENYPYDGFFAVGGFGNPGHKGQDISNRYVKAEGSTELRTLGERFADVVNVKDFGAKGDGVTDDTAAIQAALNSSVGKVTWFPGGSYVVSSVNVPNGVCSIDFNHSRIIKSSTESVCVRFDNCENLTICNVHFRDLNGNNRAGFLRGEGLKNFKLVNTEIYNSTKDDQVTGCWAVTLSGENIQINGITIDQKGYGLWGDGIHFGRVKNLVLDNFVIQAGDDAIAVNVK